MAFRSKKDRVVSDLREFAQRGGLVTKADDVRGLAYAEALQLIIERQDHLLESLRRLQAGTTIAPFPE
jgi:hypothetical protein